MQNIQLWQEFNNLSRTLREKNGTERREKSFNVLKTNVEYLIVESKLFSSRFPLVFECLCQKQSRGATGSITIWSPVEGGTAVSLTMHTHSPAHRAQSHILTHSRNFTLRPKPRSWGSTDMDKHANAHAGTTRSIEKHAHRDRRALPPTISPRCCPSALPIDLDCIPVYYVLCQLGVIIVPAGAGVSKTIRYGWNYLSNIFLLQKMGIDSYSRKHWTKKSNFTKGNFILYQQICQQLYTLHTISLHLHVWFWVFF